MYIRLTSSVQEWGSLQYLLLPSTNRHYPTPLKEGNLVALNEFHGRQLHGIHEGPFADSLCLSGVVPACSDNTEGHS